MSPESARPVTAGTSMPGCHRSRSCSLGSSTALREGLEDAEHVPRLVSVRRAELAHRQVQRRGQRLAQRLVRPGLELAGAPARAHRRASAWR